MIPAGKVSLTVVVPVEFDGPAFETVILYWPLPPAVNVPCATFAIERSKLLTTGVVPLDAGPLLPALESPGLLTVAVLATNGFDALAASVTSKINMLLPPAAIILLLVQLTFGTAPVQVQPLVEPTLTLYPVTPAGSVSATVVVPDESDGPAFETVILYWPLPPAVNVPCATFAMLRSKLVLSAVGGVVIGPLPLVQLGHSFGFETETTLPLKGVDADEEMFTSKISMLLPPDAMEFELVQTALGAAPVQVQPGVEPALMLYPVMPVGKVSLTVVVPVEFDGPAFETVILY